MKSLKTQLAFDGKRLILRNFSYIFFSLLMPAGLYSLFTKVMSVGSSPQMKLFYVTYMDSMIVYSILISALFGIAAILKRDRDQGLVTFLSLSAYGTLPYYLSVAFWMLMMSLFSVAVMGSLAVVINGVNLHLDQWLALFGIVLIGQLPLMLIGIGLSYIRRYETLSLASNLITFPMAIVSGLWWPINMLPKWLQSIGELMPTYFVNQLLNQLTSRAKVDLTNLLGIAAWFVVTGLLVIALSKHEQRKGVALGEA